MQETFLHFQSHSTHVENLQDNSYTCSTLFKKCAGKFLHFRSHSTLLKKGVGKSPVLLFAHHSFKNCAGNILHFHSHRTLLRKGVGTFSALSFVQYSLKDCAGKFPTLSFQCIHAFFLHGSHLTSCVWIFPTLFNSSVHVIMWLLFHMFYKLCTPALTNVYKLCTKFLHSIWGERFLNFQKIIFHLWNFGGNFLSLGSYLRLKNFSYVYFLAVTSGFVDTT